MNETKKSSDRIVTTSSSNMSTNDAVVLLEFFQQATQSLQDLMLLVPSVIVVDDTIDEPSSSSSSSSSSYQSQTVVSKVRQILLSKQAECLQSSIDTCRCKAKKTKLNNIDDTHDDDNNNNNIDSDVDGYTVAHLKTALQNIHQYCSIDTTGTTDVDTDADTDTTITATTDRNHNNNNNNNGVGISPTTLKCAMEHLNDTARITFCHLVLYNEFLYDNEQQQQQQSETTMATTTTIGVTQRKRRTLISSVGTSDIQNTTTASTTTMKATDVLEFCALCSTAIRIPNIRQYIQYGTSTTAHNTSPFVLQQQQIFDFPQQRLQHIQRLFLRAIGYDPDYGTQLIQTMFYSIATTSINSNNNDNIDPQVISTFRTMEQLMEQTLVEITNKITDETLLDTVSTVRNIDINDGSIDDVTRIVAVTYSEKYIDPTTGQEIRTIYPDDQNDDDNNNYGAPRSLIMTHDTISSSSNNGIDRHENHADELLQKASVLEQEILKELLSMSDEDRGRKIIEMNTIVQTVTDQITTIAPVGPEQSSHDQIALYLTNLDSYTQKCMIMKKIWDNYCDVSNQK